MLKLLTGLPYEKIEIYYDGMDRVLRKSVAHFTGSGNKSYSYTYTVIYAEYTHVVALAEVPTDERKEEQITTCYVEVVK